MSRLPLVLVMLATAVALLAGGHYYIYARLVRAPGLPPPWPTVLRWSLTALAIAMPASFVVMRMFRMGATRPFMWAVYLWMGLFFYLVVLLGIADLARLSACLLAKVAGRPDALASPERRQFLARLMGGVVIATAGGIVGSAIRSALGKLRLVDVEVKLRRLPASLDGTTIVHLTDLHLGPTIRGTRLAEIVDQVNALSPDVVAITGDLVDASVGLLRDEVAPLARLRTRHGAFFVTGNHEYYISPDGVSGADEWLAELRRLGVRPLRNERVSIGTAEAGIDIAGVDDFNARGLPGHGPDLGRALDGRDREREVVLLAHQPRAVVEASASDVGLVLAGHTHGGQIWPWSYLVLAQQPYIAGLHRHGPRTQIYVNRGAGYWGPPMRFGAPPEIARVTLRREDA